MADLYIGREDEFGERDRKIIAQGDLEIGVFHVGGEFFAYENNCVHQGGPVCQGKIMGRVKEDLGKDKTSKGLRFSESDIHIVCPWHGWGYDLSSCKRVDLGGGSRSRLERLSVTDRGAEGLILQKVDSSEDCAR